MKKNKKAGDIMKSLILILVCSMSGSATACQYGMDSSRRMDEVIERLLPDATDVSGDGLQDTTIFSSDMFSSDCPRNFRLSGHLKFIRNGKHCRGKIVLKYRDNDYSTGKIKFISCRN